MPKSQLTKKRRGVSPRRVLGAVVALVVAFILCTSVIGLLRKYSAVQGRVRTLYEQKRAAEEKKQTIQKLNQYLQTPAGEEYQLRSKYNIVKPGEELIVITESELQTNQKSKTIMARWWEAIVRGLGLRNGK